MSFLKKLGFSSEEKKPQSRALKIERNIVFITSTLPEFHGGRTASLLHRARLLTAYLDNEITILTTNFNINYDRVYKSFLKRKLVNYQIKHINIYQDIAKEAKPINKNNYKVFLSKIKNLSEDDVSLNQTSERIEIIDKNKGRFYLILDKNGNVYQTVSHPKGKPDYKRDEFFDPAGNKYLIKNFIKDKNKKFKLDNLIYANGKYSSDPIYFQTEKDFFLFWFENIISSNSSVINDARLLDKPLLDLNIENVKKIFQLHSNHIKDNISLSSGIKGSYKTLLNRNNEASEIIVLTKQQAEDISTTCELAKPLAVIPHTYKELPKLKEYKRNDIVVVSRLSKEKKLDDIINIFEKIHILNSDIKLHIYGEGDEENYLKELDQEKNLSDKILFHGFSDNVNKIFQKAKCSLVTSEYEGFPLTVMESLINGCPCVSYDMKYGPATMIKNGENGYLVERGNVDDFAEKLKSIIANEVVFEEAEVQQSMKGFSNEEFVRKWIEIIK